MTESNAPLLKPYPSWQAHRALNANDTPDVVSPFHIKVDRCNRLWALDTGIDGQLNADGNGSKRLAPPRILIFDLRTDNFIRQYELSALKLENSIFSNIAVDDEDCENTFAYVADSGIPPSITVYSYKLNESWQVKHNFFNIDPLAGNFSILGVSYRTTDGVYGLALSEKRSNGFADLYFHSLTSFSEFNVSTAILRNRSIAESASTFYKEFTNIGSRGLNGQAGASVYDKSNNVIFYTLPNQNKIGCWKTTDKNYSIDNGNVFTSPVKMVYPIDLKIDSKERLWVLSNNLQQFLNGNLNPNNVNFYVHVVPVKEAIKNTACEPGFIENVVNKFNKALRDDGKGASTSHKPTAILTFIVSYIVIWMHPIF